MDQIDLTKNEELQKALKEFEEKNAEDEAQSLPKEKPPKSSKLAQWLVSHSGGVIKDETQAEYALLAFVLISLAISGAVFFSGGVSTEEPPTSSFIQEAGSARDFLP